MTACPPLNVYLNTNTWSKRLCEMPDTMGRRLLSVSNDCADGVMKEKKRFFELVTGKMTNWVVLWIMHLEALKLNTIYVFMT